MGNRRATTVSHQPRSLLSLVKDITLSCVCLKQLPVIVQRHATGGMPNPLVTA
jgi:hypothetical protein